MTTLRAEIAELKQHIADSLPLYVEPKLALRLIAQIERMEAALNGLYEQMDSLEDFKFSRDLPAHEAEDNWRDARYSARKALKHMDEEQP